MWIVNYNIVLRGAGLEQKIKSWYFIFFQVKWVEVTSSCEGYLVNYYVSYLSIHSPGAVAARAVRHGRGHEGTGRDAG